MEPQARAAAAEARAAATATIDLTAEDEERPMKKVKQQEPTMSLPNSVWVLTKADHAEYREHLASCTVIGVFVKEAAAKQAKAKFLQDGSWEEGYGYHQGDDAESAIEIERSALHP